jgi:hypothetical protein
MTITRNQKIGLAFFIFSLIPSYFIAQWRYEYSVQTITEELEREHALHLSTDKLLSNCANDEAKENTNYGANHQICNLGLQEHALSEYAMSVLEQEKVSSDAQRYRVFALLVLMLNLLGWIANKANQLLGKAKA